MIYHINQKDLPERGLLPLMAGYVHNLWCIHTADFARLIQRLIKNWIAKDCEVVFKLHRNGHQHSFPLGSVLIYRYPCLSRSLYLSSVNPPFYSIV